MVYTPLETRLLTDARARGLQTISGVEMFVHQAVLQFERFNRRTGTRRNHAPRRHGAFGIMNIVLIGYRGTGKSVVGRILADRLNWPYAGMDANIVVRAGMPIPAIVEKYGWPKFRDIETEEALDLARQDHLIIDTGGGIIERPENVPTLEKNGCIVWLKASGGDHC